MKQKKVTHANAETSCIGKLKQWEQLTEQHSYVIIYYSYKNMDKSIQSPVHKPWDPKSPSFTCYCENIYKIILTCTVLYTYLLVNYFTLL